MPRPLLSLSASLITVLGVHACAGAPPRTPPAVEAPPSIAYDSAVSDEGTVSPIVSVPFQPIGNAKNWMVARDLTYRVGSSQDSIVVPAGFVTDFASIPPAFQSFISPFGSYLLPAVVHDYLYWEQGCSRNQADRLFLRAMEEMQVPQARREAMYTAVHRFGKRAWRQNARDRNDLLPRHVPSSGVSLPAPLESWPAYRLGLKSQGVLPNPQVTIPSSFCSHGGRE